MGPIKEVVSVSIGSSRRDHEVEIDLLGERFRIRREGTDGDMERAVARLRELDGTVDAFGLGGIDLFLRAADRDYYFRDGRRFGQAVSRTPIVDGTGLKGAVEGDIARFMREDLGLTLAGKKVLVTSAVDRWGMTEAFHRAGCEMAYGDLLYALGIPVIIHRWGTLVAFVRTLAPIVSQLPFKLLYPTEDDHESATVDKHGDLYRWADVVVGDYKYVRKFMPDDMRGKWVVTNTTTAADVEFLRARGVELLVTSTPRLDGRSFGTNVMEATLIALRGATSSLPAEEYLAILREVGFSPDVQWLQRSEPTEEAAAHDV